MPNLFSGPKVVVLNRAMSQLLIPAARRLESTRASVPYPQSGGAEKQLVLNHSANFAAWLPEPPAPLAHPWTASGRMLAMPTLSASSGVDGPAQETLSGKPFWKVVTPSTPHPETILSAMPVASDIYRWPWPKGRS